MLNDILIKLNDHDKILNTMKLSSVQWKPLDRVELESFIGFTNQYGVHWSNHKLLSVGVSSNIRH